MFVFTGGKFQINMKKCIAFTAIPGTREAWLPCVRLAQSGHALCRLHSDVVGGVMLGIFVSGIGDEAANHMKKGTPSRRSKLAPVKSSSASRANDALKAFRCGHSPGMTAPGKQEGLHAESQSLSAEMARQ